MKFIKSKLNPSVQIMDLSGSNLREELMAGALMARNSRIGSNKSLEQVYYDEYVGNEEKAAKFFERWYIGYGHSSIAECIHLKLHFENIPDSMMTEFFRFKFLSGIQRSTRYTKPKDYFQYDIEDFTGNRHQRLELYNELCESYMRLFNRYYDETFESLKLQYPDYSSDPAVEKALKAKSYDVARFFLPSTTLTTATIDINLRSLLDILAELQASATFNGEMGALRPFTRYIGDPLKDLLKDLGYDIFFKHFDSNVDKSIKMQGSYHHGLKNHHDDFDLWNSCVNEPQQDLITNIFGDKLYTRRDIREPILPILDDFELYLPFKCSYGTYRDIQRHRKLRCHVRLEAVLPRKDNYNMNILTYSNFYDLYRKNFDVLNMLVPFGTPLKVYARGTLRDFIYACELRTGEEGHYEYRKIFQEIASYIQAHYPIRLDTVDWRSENEIGLGRLLSEKRNIKPTDATPLS